MFDTEAAESSICSDSDMFVIYFAFMLTRLFVAGLSLKKRVTNRGRVFVGGEQQMYYEHLNPKPVGLGPQYLGATDDRFVKIKFIPPSVAKQRKHCFVGEMVSTIASYVSEIADKYGDKPQHIGFTVGDLLAVDPKSNDKITRFNKKAWKSLDWELREKQYLTIFLIYRTGRLASYGVHFHVCR